MYQVCRMMGAWIFIDVKVIVLLVSFFFFKPIIIELSKNFNLPLLVLNSANFVFSPLCKILR